MYADKETQAMRAAISETDRRREIQLAYNEEHGITAATIVKGISDIAEFLQAESKVPRGRKRRKGPRAGKEMPRHELERMVVELEEEWRCGGKRICASEIYAAQLRDEAARARKALTLKEIQASEASRDRVRVMPSSSGQHCASPG